MTLRLPKAALLLALPALAVPAFAQSEEPDQPAPKPDMSEKMDEVEKSEEKKICKRISAQAGSRRKTKVCKTREQWKTFNQDQRRRN